MTLLPRTNETLVARNVRFATCAVAPFTVTTPANLSYFHISPTTVTGTVDDPTATVTVNAIAAAVVNSRFSAVVPLTHMVLDGHFGHHAALHMVRGCVVTSDFEVAP